MVTETDTVGLSVRLLVRCGEDGPVLVDCTIDPSVHCPEFVEGLENLVVEIRRSRAGRHLRLLAAPARA